MKFFKCDRCGTTIKSGDEAYLNISMPCSLGERKYDLCAPCAIMVKVVIKEGKEGK